MYTLYVDGMGRAYPILAEIGESFVRCTDENISSDGDRNHTLSTVLVLVGGLSARQC